MSRRTYAADDFEAIRSRLDELHRQRYPQRSGGPDTSPGEPEPDAAAHRPRRPRMPQPSTTRHPGSL
jgi:hypothetical protein